jgi:sensor domain CHASE-containing protein
VPGAAELLGRIGEKWSGDARWSKSSAVKANNAAPASVWKLTDEKGQAWEASASVEQAGGRLVLVLKVARGANGARAQLK